MKKTYITPSFISVKLNPQHMIAESLMKYSTGDGGAQLIKEENNNNSTVNDVNLWDKEW